MVAIRLACFFPLGFLGFSRTLHARGNLLHLAYYRVGLLFCVFIRNKPSTVHQVELQEICHSQLGCLVRIKS